MNNTIIKTSLTLLLALVALTASAQIKVTARLDSMRIPLGGQTSLRIGVEAPKSTAITWPALRQGKEITKGVMVVEVQKEDTKTTQGTTTTVKPYVITSFQPGRYTIPVLTVTAGGKSYKSDTLTLVVDSVALDKANPQKAYPPKDIQNNPFSWMDWWLPVLLLLLTAALLVAIVWTVRRLKKNKPLRTHVRVVEVIPPHMKAMKRIEQLQKEEPADSKEYYTNLTDTLRQYITERFGINAMEMTTDQLIDTLKQEQDKEKTDELVEVFRTADLAKFAKYSTPGSENKYNLDSVVRFIETTKENIGIEHRRVADDAEAQQQAVRKSRRMLKTAVVAEVVLAVVLLVWAAVIVADLVM